jgi:hypothetical protein
MLGLDGVQRQGSENIPGSLTLPPRHMAAATSPTRHGVLGITRMMRTSGPAASMSLHKSSGGEKGRSERGAVLGGGQKREIQRVGAAAPPSSQVRGSAQPLHI